MNMSETQPSDKLVRLAEAARRAGVSKQSLQYYLLVGLVEASARSAGGQQLFDEKTIDRVRLIKRLNDSGYPLREIRDIFLREKPEHPLR
jgi:DNA-binding transcriptional MerR regulator